MNILERIKKLEDEVESLRIIDTEDIIAEDTGLGIALHLEDPSTDSGDDDDYQGGFKVIKTTVNEVPSLKVIYGKHPNLAYCGEIEVPNPDGEGYLKCPVVNFPITGNTQYITLLLIYDLATEKYSAVITSKDNAWDTIPAGYNPGLAFQIAEHVLERGIDQHLEITGGRNGQLRLELQARYWV